MARQVAVPLPADASPRAIAAQVRMVLAWLKRRGTRRNRDGMARYAIPSDHAFGVSMATMRELTRQLGRNHALARALWKTGWYEARTLVAFVADPAEVTSADMDGWCREFDNWAICDSLCFYLFDKSPHAWRKVGTWSRRRPEFEKRAGFALLAALALHDKQAPDSRFVAALPLIERGATDERNFVKKGVSWAMRSIGHRNVPLHTAACDLAARLARADDATARWVGKDTLRDLRRPGVLRRLEARAGRAATGRARPR